MFGWEGRISPGCVWWNCGIELAKHSLSVGWVWKLSHCRADSVAEKLGK